MIGDHYTFLIIGQSTYSILALTLVAFLLWYASLKKDTKLA